MRRVCFSIAVLACLAGLPLFAHAATPAPIQAPPRLLAPLSDGESPELPPLDERVPRPEAFLGYPLGERFTPWDRIQGYFDALASASNRVKVWTYGETYEGRPLKLVALGSPENLAHLDELREEHLRLADPGALSPDERERMVHPQISRRIVSWLDTFGRANAAAFDRQGWVYFKGQSYDLFYPGYGDSYPSLRGAVGMTYEMAGGGRGGVALTLPDGTPLTLADRIARHFP